MDSNTEVMSISAYVKQLRKKEIGFFDIPEEFRSNSDIIRIERELGIRTSGKKGFDVIRNRFFVKETITAKNFCDKTVETTFLDFCSYFEFLEGDIYENACYYQYNFTQEELSTYRIDLSRIKVSSFIDFTITSITAESPKTDLLQYEEREEEKRTRKKWIAKFNNCKTYDQFQQVIKQFNSSGFSQFDLSFYIFNFIFSDKERAFDIIMQYVSGGFDDTLAKELCIIYDPQKVLQAYNYNCGTKQTNYKHKKKLKDFVKKLEQIDIQYKNSGIFEENTHFYRYQVSGYTSAEQREPFVGYPMYFETFNELADFLNKDLSDCDLSNAILPDIDFSAYKTNEQTILPIQRQKDLTHKVYKGYDRKSGCFIFQEAWKDKIGNFVKRSKPYKFEYFFDFIYFLENDLSNADLLFCDGLLNLRDFSNLNLKDAKLHSKLLDRLNVAYQPTPLDMLRVESFNPVVSNENETETALEYKRETYNEIETSIGNRKIYYISDLHLLHRLQGKCKTKEDVTYEVQKIIDSILADISYSLDQKGMLLIGGDTSSDFQIFIRFITLLRQTINILEWNVKVIFILGNHELWELANNTLHEIIQKYEDVLKEQKMYLLQNNILYSDDSNNIHKITTNELIIQSRTDIRDTLKSARVILFGGLAFSGQNTEFNAKNRIYRATISRTQEIEESAKFNSLYDIVCNTLPDRNVIVFTHTPQKDWCSADYQQLGFVYVSGHTHRNYFYDDGEYRIYADNQIGYGKRTPHLKYFYLDDTYDIFLDHGDGIYKITKEQYIDFYRGKNIRMDFTREINILYMLKKSGYYCFIHQSKNGNLTILNGGAMKSLDVLDINYYYERMDGVICYIKQPLDKFSDIQNQIANTVKKIGGRGIIHGAIIDIDCWNHIYVNPNGRTITGYWASDIINKKIYPSIPNLLEANCPALYENYTKMIVGDSKSELAIPDNVTPGIPTQIYLDTDIYKASREIKKMQKLNSNILSTWHEPMRPMLE
ncbi:hypothetical protein D7X33_18810 [Butyricicoccus sp. 1XD8-22]|nr:hypothetical protein D7X33_18810 [Butyricicoccus sp. 1XD8-22]